MPYYYDAGIEQAWTLYLIHRHFPRSRSQFKPVALERLLAPLRSNRYNTLSSALTVLALDALRPGTPSPTAAADAAGRRPGRQGATDRQGSAASSHVGQFTAQPTRASG